MRLLYIFLLTGRFTLPIVSSTGRKIKIVCEPCFVDYQSTAIGILRNRGSREDNNCQCPASFTLACVINFFLFCFFFVLFRFL